jgi:hypothetical protein
MESCSRVAPQVLCIFNDTFEVILENDSSIFCFGLNTFELLFLVKMCLIQQMADCADFSVRHNIGSC